MAGMTIAVRRIVLDSIFVAWWVAHCVCRFNGGNFFFFMQKRNKKLLSVWGGGALGRAGLGPGLQGTGGPVGGDAAR
jgi:hypothetical protein